jgi:hypothetical protein
LGTLDVLSHNYLVFATEVFLVGKYFDSAVYHIAAVDFLPFGDRPKEGDVRDKTKDILSELQTVGYGGVNVGGVFVWVLF